MIHLIVNPIAGRGKTPARAALLKQAFDALDIAYDEYITQCVMDGYEKARAICENDPACTGIVGLGGDGTLQEIAAGMRDAFPGNKKVPVPLGVFPAGSGNDFVMSLMDGKSAALARYKEKRLPEAARIFAQSVKENRTRCIDLITANGMAYMNIGNMGLDARIVSNALALKERYGRYAYIAAVYRSIARHTNVPMKIEVNGQEIDSSYTLVAVSNGRYYGGGLQICPGAKIDDGKIMLCLVDGMPRLKTMIIFPSLMIAQHTRLKAVRFLTCDEVKITLGENANKGESLCLDGNLYPHQPGHSIHFKMHPQAIDVFV